MIDTHTHLYLPDFHDGGAPAVRRALCAGVRQMVFPNVDLGTIAPMNALAAEFPGVVFTALGLHPTEVGGSWRDDLDVIAAGFAAGHRHVAVARWESIYIGMIRPASRRSRLSTPRWIWPAGWTCH